MKKMAFLIFFSIVISIYTLINLYLYNRGMQALPAGMVRSWFPYVFWGLVSTYVLGRFLEKVYLNVFSDALVWIGSFWLAAMLYFFLIIFVLDLIRLIHHFLPFFPEYVTAHYQKIKAVLFWFAVGSVSITVLLGHLNTLYPVHRKLDIVINKETPKRNQLNVVLLSDIHLGTIIGNGHFERIVNKVQSLNPDIILLAGDVLDEDLEPVLRQNIGETLKRLHAPLGVFAIMGNHEYIGGAEPAYNYLKSYGINILRDSVIKIEDGFYLIGREDRDKNRFSGENRLALDALVAKTDRSYPIILMDHQPYYLEQAADLGVDLQVSGHTHHGQLWPLHWITSSIFTISQGYGKIGNMHAYVSNGVGTWGPPVRVGNRPEIVELRLRFEK